MKATSVIVTISCISLASCEMVQSYPIAIHGGDPPQASGSYYLAKHVLQLDVTSGGGAATTIAASVVAVPDTSAHMQIGFELSPFSEDNIQIDYANGLLKQISATAIDKSAEIVVAIAQDVALFRVGKDASPSKIVIQFDPFDPADALAANNKLGKGNCVEVEIDHGKWSNGCPAVYSMKTKGVSIQEVAAYESEHLLPSMPVAPGIYYRRPIPRRVHIVIGGRTSELKNYFFSNNAPVLRVDINRTAFVTRETKVFFTDGELTSVSVKKESEALAVAKLPVQVFDAYMGGVVNVLKLSSDLEKAQANNLNAQAERIKAQTAYEKTRAQSLQPVTPEAAGFQKRDVTADSDSAFPADKSSSGSASRIEACVREGGTLDSCSTN